MARILIMGIVSAVVIYCYFFEQDAFIEFEDRFCSWFKELYIVLRQYTRKKRKAWLMK